MLRTLPQPGTNQRPETQPLSKRFKGGGVREFPSWPLHQQIAILGLMNLQPVQCNSSTLVGLHSLRAPTT
eukprot:2762865-Amphidinium_carterae.1